MFVRELMSVEVVTVDVDATLREAVGKLLAEDVGSVIAVDGETPTGLVTETDALRAAHERGQPLGAISVRDLAHPPVVTTDPDSTVQNVARKMTDENVKKVVVTDDLRIAGIITLTDIVWHLSELRNEAAELAESDWNPN